MMKTSHQFLTLALTAGILTHASAESPKFPLKKEKLQIVFCFGQSNMVGLASVPTAWYLTQPAYVPPKEFTTRKTRFFDWNFYWRGADYYVGPKKAELAALVEERQMSRMKWRQRINGATWEDAWGSRPDKGRDKVYAFLDEKAEQEGIYRKIAEILDSKDNQFHVDQAYAEMIGRDERIKGQLAIVREIFLKDTKPEDFDAFAAAVQEAGINELKPNPEEQRAQYAALAEKHLHLPIAKRTRIFGHGSIAGSEGTGKTDRSTQGPLSVGYGGGITKIGPEYGLGITLEKLVDAPILLVKCAWGNTSIAGAWRAPSLDGVETPKEKANREAWNRNMAEKAKAEGSEFKPTSPPAKTGELAWAWNQVMPQVDKVLADPGKFHPGYDPKVGYEVAGMVWFQGFSDKDNTAYGELLAQLIKDFRTKVKSPRMPVVCGSLGMAAFQNLAFSMAPNRGMVEVSQMPDFKGTVDVVNSSPFYPLELDLWKQVRDLAPEGSPEHTEATRIGQKATSNVGFHYQGSAKFFLLLGNAMGNSLANLMAGGEPGVDPKWIE